MDFNLNVAREEARRWQERAQKRESDRTKLSALSATAYLLDQEHLLESIRDESFAFGGYKTYQVSIAKVEELTGLRFDGLRAFEPTEALESLGRDATREITSFADLRLYVRPQPQNAHLQTWVYSGDEATVW